MVTLTFDVKVPEAGSATRVMGDEKINSLHLIVFDEQGYFTYKAAAKLAAVADDEFPYDPTTRQFSVELPNSSAKRIIHFVANISGQYNNIEAGHEDGVMSSLYVDDNADAYWQRMEYNGGIANDASTADFASGAIIPLVRNYAKIKVQAAQNSGFTLKGFKVFNTYSQGSIAAYDGEFVEFVEMNTATDSESRMFTPKTYDEMGDYGCNEMGSLDTDGIGNYASTADVYVRETPSDAKPYIIIFGTYSGKDCYYKLEFDGKHIYRNFEYTFNIKSVTKAGHTEEGDAKSSTAEGSGLSYDKSTANLLNLSDGKSQLYVSAMTIVMVDNTRTYELKYKYVPDINNGAVDNTKASVNCTLAGNKVISSLDYNPATTDSEGYTTITITPAITMPSSVQGTVIEIKDGKNLVRNVNVYLMPPYQMAVNAYDGGNEPIDKGDEAVPAGVKQKVWVDVAIPTDVQPALFPLEFVFETAAQSLYPDPDAPANTMPVRTGKSIIDNSKTSFGFVYTLDSLAYKGLQVVDGKKTFTAEFLTNKAASTTTVYVYNEYFTTGYDDFKNSKLERTNNITVTLGSGADYYGAGRPVTLDITLLEAPAGTEVSVDVTGFNITGTKATTYTTDSNGQVKLSLSTSDWGGPRSVTVSSTAVVETETAIIKYNQGSTSTTVKKIDIPAGKFKLGSEISQTTTLYYENGSSTEETVVFGYYYNESDTNSAKTIEIEGLEENTKLYLHYTSWSYGAGTTTYKTGLFSVKDLVNDGIINLTFQK